jgi:hypothetical protein
MAFFLFSKMKEIMKGRHFHDIRSSTLAALEAILQNQFQNSFEVWTMSGHGCMSSQGEYYEGGHSDIHQ